MGRFPASCWPKMGASGRTMNRVMRTVRQQIGFIKGCIEQACRTGKIRRAQGEQGKDLFGCVVKGAKRLDVPPTEHPCLPILELGRASFRDGPPSHSVPAGEIGCLIEAKSVDPPDRQNRFHANLLAHPRVCTPPCQDAISHWENGRSKKRTDSSTDRIVHA